MSKIKVLVVEDEIIIADNICKTLQTLGYNVLEPALNFSEAIEIIEQKKPDIAILDIHLSGKKTGIDLAKIINETYQFPFIFLTANADFNTVNAAKEVRPYAYLVKPFSKNELFTSIEIAISNFQKKEPNRKELTKNSIFIKQKNSFNKILFDEILFIKSDHIYIEIHCTDQRKLIDRTSLNEIYEKLNTDFIRIQRGYIVNGNYVTKIDQNSLQIADYIIPIGKKYKQNVLKKLKL
ncbi:LytR/AlgR family response regulator transcription factor [Polaribacter sp. R77954]|uniref:LytR/AlgR family response regulator transcription factor n=1 Tax=Polaribacter sp. R77954 TaxID=3093870 RepID=UPI0037C5FEBD